MKQSKSVLEHEISNGDWDSEYADYIMNNCGGERVICNGDTLIEAMEDGYLLEEFINHLMTIPAEDE